MKKLTKTIKTISELKTAFGRAINTAGNHPYLVKVDNSYIDPILESNKERISSVLNTLTLDCLLNDFSLDQIASSEANAKAKYCTSLLCGASLSASSAHILNSLNGIKSISSFMNLNTFTSSSDESLLLSKISSRCLPISKNRNSGAISFSALRILFSENTLNALPFDSNAEKTLLESTTKNINNQLFKESLNLCANDLSTFSDSSATSFSVSLLFDTMDFSSSNFSNFCLISFLATDDQFILNSSISSLSSLGKGTLNSNSDMLENLRFSALPTAVLTSPIANSENEYLKVLKNQGFFKYPEILKNLKEIFGTPKIPKEFFSERSFSLVSDEKCIKLKLPTPKELANEVKKDVQRGDEK